MGELALGGVPRVAHCAAFYGSPAGFVACVRAFVGEALDAAEPVLVAAPGPSIGVLREHLNGHGQGVSWADMSRIGANPARIIPAIGAFASSYPGRPVRCVVQPLWDGRSAAQRRETIRHEALINLLCQVEDSGHISDPLVGRHLPASDGGNQGMWIVHQLCDLVEIRTGPAGTQIRVHMQLRSAAAESGVT